MRIHATTPLAFSLWTKTSSLASASAFITARSIYSKRGSFLLITNHHQRRHVHLAGNTSIRTRINAIRTLGISEDAIPPADPTSAYSPVQIDEAANRLVEWFQFKKSVLCITGAGLSTESGIPDYRGHRGSYFQGHKPMIHDQFMTSERNRKRYWGRAMAGWRSFAQSRANQGHFALTKLDHMDKIGVQFDDRDTFFLRDQSHQDTIGSGKMSIITQNVDGLHHKSGSQYVTELHGRNDRLVCMSCGHFQCRHHFHDLLNDLNTEFMETILNENESDNEKNYLLLRPDGDANLKRDDVAFYDDLLVPPCPRCGTGFLKPDVVFFGDSVPKARVNRCYAAVEASDGLLCIGSSLAVHSAFRFVQAAASSRTPIAILNVGETRAESSNLDVTKIEAPVGAVLSRVAELLNER